MNVSPPAFILIPYQLLADERVKPLEEKLYGFIYWMTRLKNEKCTAGNDTLAALLKTTPAVVQNSLTNLEKRGYIRRTFKDRNRRVRDEIIPLIDFNNVETPAESPARKRAAKAEVVKADPEDPAGKEINEMIKMFEPVNPSYERLFAVIPQRRALERMIKKHGKAKVEGAIRAAIGAFGKTYAPSITTPLQLEHKLGQLVAYWNRENKRGPQLVTI
jgi:hypothetical protein